MTLGIKHNQDVFASFYFVDTKYAAVSKELMQKVIGVHRCTLLPVPGPLTLDQMLPKILEPGSPTKRAVLAPHDWDLYASYARVSQDDPLWLSARGRPGLITASTLADFCLLHSDHCAFKLHVPNFMSRSAGPSKCWSDHLARLHCPALPSAPLDALMGAIFTTHGKEHENNANMHFFCRHPNLRYRDQGVTYVSPAILARAGLTNQLTGQPILDLPFLLGASPDGLFEVIEPTGDPDFDEGGCVEWKAAKNVKLSYSRSTPFRGLAASHDNSSKPYDAIKSYYVPQSQDQLLACEKKVAFWGCWTLSGGMRVWRIRKSTEYLSLMLTVLIHLYETFVLQDRVVPDDYFDSDAAPADARAVHARLVDLTADIINMRRPDIAALYKEYPPADTEALVAEALLGDPRKSVTEHIRPNLARFPDFPPWLPAYAAVGMCVVALTPAQVCWQEKPGNVNQRLRNLSALFAHIPELGFLGPLMDAIRAGNPAAENFAGFENHENVQMMRADRMERLVVLALTTLMKPDGARPAIRDLAKLSNLVPGGVDRVFGLTPCNQMFLALRDLKTPGVELEIGLKYYLKIAPNIISDRKNMNEEEEEKHPLQTVYPGFSIDHLHSRIFSDQGETRDILGSPITQEPRPELKRPAPLEIFDSDNDDDIEVLFPEKRPKTSILSPAVQSAQILALDSMPAAESGESLSQRAFTTWTVSLTGSGLDEIRREFADTGMTQPPLHMIDAVCDLLKAAIRDTACNSEITLVLNKHLEVKHGSDN